MINPAIETDLIGEIAEIYRVRWSGGEAGTPYRPYESVMARGMIRAVTTSQHGDLRVWLEILPPEKLKYLIDGDYGPRFQGHPDAKVGDIVVAVISLLHDEADRLRLITRRLS